jgi:hypothetical protein
MVMSSRKANPSVQGGVAVGLVVMTGRGVFVGMTGVFPWTKCGVAVAALGGTKSVGGGVGAHPTNRKKADMAASKPG